MTSGSLPVFKGEYTPGFTIGLLAPRYWAIWAGLLLLWLLSLLPRPLRHALARPLGRLAWSSSGKRRHIAEINLRLCFPAMTDAQRQQMIRQHFYYKMQVMLDYSVIWWGSRRRIARLIRLDGAEHLEQLRDAGSPVILAVAHSLALDFGPALMTQTFSSYGMAQHAKNPLADWLMQRGRTRFLGRVHMRNAGLKNYLRAADRTDSLFYLPDEDHGEKHSVFAPFYQVQKATLTTTGRMARIARARVIPAITLYHPSEKRYVMTFLPPLDNFPSGDDLQDASRMNQSLEALIDLSPEQYLWTMRLFRTRPGNESSVYDQPG